MTRGCIGWGLTREVLSFTAIAMLGSFLYLLMPLPALANGPSVGFDAGGIVPLANNDIQLVGEIVSVPIEGGRVRCQYELKNLSSQPISLAMGFVTHADWLSQVGSLALGYHNADLQVRHHAQMLPVRMEALASGAWNGLLTAPPDSLPVWDLSFAPHERVLLHVSYDCEPTTGCEGNRCSMTSSYYASTARLWAGSVEHATIEFKFGALTSLLMDCAGDTSKCFAIETEPANSVREHGMVKWEFFNWEPTEDFSVRVKWGD